MKTIKLNTENQTTELLEGILNVLKNDRDALRKFIIDIMNIKYDFKNHTGAYKILSSEQIDGLHQLHLSRKTDKTLNYRITMIITWGLVIGGAIWLVKEMVDKKS